MIIFLRHGDAEANAEDDASRPLTAKGMRQAEAAGAALAVLGVELECCLSSPKLRALETAERAAAPLGLRVETSEALRGGDFDALALAGGRGPTLLVGHEPDFSRAVQLLCGGRVEMKKGGLAIVENGALLALYRPAALRRIAAAGNG